jgi:hypothetical protein
MLKPAQHVAVRMPSHAIWLLALFFLVAIPRAHAEQKNNISTNSDFDGTWKWRRAKEELTLTLQQTGNHLEGRHVAIGQNGAKVDEISATDPPSIVGEVDRSTARVNFRSGFPGSTGGGTARIRRVGQGLTWRIVSSTGEHYLPSFAHLTRSGHISSRSNRDTACD